MPPIARAQAFEPDLTEIGPRISFSLRRNYEVVVRVNNESCALILSRAR